MKKERWKLYLFIEDIAFKSNNFSKFLSVKLPLRPCKIMDPKEKSLSTGALLIKAVLYFNFEGGRDQYYKRQLSTSWADLHLQPTASH